MTSWRLASCGISFENWFVSHCIVLRWSLRAAAVRGRGQGLPLRARMVMVRFGDHRIVDALSCRRMLVCNKLSDGLLNGCSYVYSLRFCYDIHSQPHHNASGTVVYSLT